MEAYEYYFGKYPFYNSGFKMIEVPYIGMEHQSAIAYGNNFKNGYRGLDFSGIGLEYDYIILHEIAHEWWGNSVSAESKNDMWINESLATYSETLLVEYVRGYEDAMVYLNHDLYYILRNNNPICDTVNGSIYGTDMYNKGSALWNTLRHIVNDDNKWMCFLRTLHDNYKYKTLSTKEILIFINEYFQEDYNYIFDQYVFSPDIPVLELFMDDISKDSVLSYRWTTCVDEFRMPIRIDTENGSINITPISFIPTRNEYFISKTDFEKSRWKYLFNILFTYEN